jgi:hypothetical protein
VSSANGVPGYQNVVLASVDYPGNISTDQVDVMRVLGESDPLDTPSVRR